MPEKEVDTPFKLQGDYEARLGLPSDINFATANLVILQDIYIRLGEVIVLLVSIKESLESDE